MARVAAASPSPASPRLPRLLGAPWTSESAHRRSISLDGTWTFTTDVPDVGLAQGFPVNGIPLSERRTAAVPASWNEQLPELDGFMGPAWYEREIWLPLGVDPQRHCLLLRFGSVNYHASVWLDGVLLGEHEGGHLPFELEIPVDRASLWGGSRPSRLVVRVDGRLARTHVPPGGGWGAMAPGCHPNTSFDFYPFCGIQRSVQLLIRPRVGLDALKLETKLLGDATAMLMVEVRASPSIAFVRAELLDAAGRPFALRTCATDSDGCAHLTLGPRKANLWAPGSPYLYKIILACYQLRSQVAKDSLTSDWPPEGTEEDLSDTFRRSVSEVDCYTQRIGMRTVRVEGDALLLNGKPIVLRGFGRHEDFPIIGRGDCAVVAQRDHACLAWVGANSYRTSHYPYSEVDLDLADAHGFLVIAETPAVGLTFADSTDDIQKRQRQALVATNELLVRDLNRTCVIAWSVCNEPGGPKTLPRPEMRELQTLSLHDLIGAARRDGTRPVTFANIPEHTDEANGACDFLSLNEYAGWYYDLGRSPEATVGAVEKKLREIHERFCKPIMISECGADTLPGCHLMSAGLWSEEWQASLMVQYASLAGKHPWLFGVHVWNLCDFRAPQMHLRAMGLNHKGVFTRLREPKLAAHKLRERWKPDEARGTAFT